MSTDFIFSGSVKQVDPEIQQLLSLEDKRQDETIILIASESMAPDAVREAMGSTFANIYAEGYPRDAARRQSQEKIMDSDWELARYRRNSDPRYYKGVEYADQLESLTRRRAAELFAANGVDPSDLYVNVQPLSGAPANSAVYTALLQPGDTILGLNLNDGGHLSHGTRINRSGKHYNGVFYFVNEETEALDFDAIEKIALEHKPRIIVAGYSAYPKVVDWARFRAIADQVGAYFLADISHISGLIASGVHPSPIGIADVVMTTTHKSLCGPRGAMLMTHRKDLSPKIDRAVFPGEQGGPHLNTMAALAIALKLAKTDQFRKLQERIVANAKSLAIYLEAHGLRIVGGGSENHLLLVDTKSVSHKGVHLSGDMAARILDVAGIVLNRNTIPGDKGAMNPTGLRLGTVWISQFGFGDAEMKVLAEAIATVLQGCKPFTYMGMRGRKQRMAKVDAAALQRGQDLVRQLRGISVPKAESETLEVRGKGAKSFLDKALTSDVAALAAGDSQPTYLYGNGWEAAAVLTAVSDNTYRLQFEHKVIATQAEAWLAMLSDGYVDFGDLYARLAGPVAVTAVSSSLTKEIGDAVGTVVDFVKALAGDGDAKEDASVPPEAFVDSKPFFVGAANRPEGDALPAFNWEEPVDLPAKHTPLYDTHVKLGGKIIPFGEYELPVWYSSVGEEHAAVRTAAGLFDATHMGVFEATGKHVVEFLNIVTTNSVNTLRVGTSHYSQFLFPDGSVIDDLLVYRLGKEEFMLVVNASNNDKDWAWLNAVNNGEVLIDEKRPFAKIQHPITLKDLRDPQWGDACRVDMPLQGPTSRDILLSLCDDADLAKRIKRLPWAGLTKGAIAGFDLIISRTGYTGEKIAYELFVHPDKAADLWMTLLEAGESFGIKSCGLAARDSTRTEAGLPLYGHEMAGSLGLNPAEAGFGAYVKLAKPFFVGRDAFITALEGRDRLVVRFRMNEKGVRRPDNGDPVLDKRGKVIGTVTSCAIDSDGYLLGQAVVKWDMRKRGTAVYIYQLGGGTRAIKLPKTIKMGARMPSPDGATILSRFPLKKKR